jgi:hypothetical protein
MLSTSIDEIQGARNLKLLVYLFEAIYIWPEGKLSEN